MSLWADYHKETEGHETIEKFFGFIRYSIEDKVCRIHDLYVRPDSRKDGLARVLANLVQKEALERGCEFLWSRVGVGSAGCDTALIANLSFGFKPRAAEGGFIIMLKDLSGEGAKNG